MNGMNETKETPRLIGVVAVPPDYTFKMGYVSDDGTLEVKPIALIGYSDFPEMARFERSNPSTRVWYALQMHYPRWESEHSHGNKSRSGACECGDPLCRSLGFFQTSYLRAVEIMTERAIERAAWLTKVTERKEKARAAYAERKAAKAS